MARVINKQIKVTTPFDFNNQRLSNLSTPTSPTDGVNKEYVDNLVSGITTGLLYYNIDVYANTGSGGIYLAANTGITLIPKSMISVYVNSIEVTVGDGVKNGICYFSSDGGTTAKSYTTIAIGDLLYWNGDVAPFDLDSTDVITYMYYYTTYDIDGKYIYANSGTSGIYLAANTGITSTPKSSVRIFVNSIEITLGNGTKTGYCFLSGDGGTTARTYNNVQINDLLYWNGDVAPFDLETSDIITFMYNI